MQTPEEQQEKWTQNILTVLGFTIAGCLVESVVQNTTKDLVRSTYKGFFSMMLEKVMHAPINLYFDVTPISRVTKSFSEDIHAIDYGFM